MRNATEIVKHVDFSQARPAAQQQPASVDAGTAQVVNSLFNELKSIFPAWKQAWPVDEALKRAKRSWIKGLMAAGIHSLEQIRFGLMTCRASGQDFAPSVGKFVEWCQPTAEQLGLPPTEKAFQEAARNSHPAVGQGGRWSHPAVHHAAMEAGLSNLFRLNEDAGRKLFERNYSIACRMVAAGQPLREIPKALPAEVSTPAKPETVNAELAKMRAALGRRS